MIPSLVDYVLIAQERRHVEHHARQAAGRWILSETYDPLGSVTLQSVQCQLDLAEVYFKIDEIGS